MKERFFWIFFNLYGWLVFGMSLVTAFLVKAWWVVLFGIIGYQAVLLVELLLGRYMGKSGAVQLAQAKQENRELHAEQARLIGEIQTLQTRLKGPQEPAASVSPLKPTAAEEISVAGTSQPEVVPPPADLPSPDGA